MDAPRFGREEEAIYAPVDGIGAAFDPMALFHAIDHAAGAGPVDLEHVGEFGLAGAGAPVEPGQHQPLGARQTDVAHAPVEHHAHQARHVGQHVADIAIVVGTHTRALPGDQSGDGWSIIVV